MKCGHCQKRRKLYEWRAKACADGGRWRKFYVCHPCDLELNAMVLRFLGDADAESKLAIYARRKP